MKNVKKVWLVTGSASGIGAAIAAAATNDGHDVVATDLDGHAVAASFASRGLNVVPESMDITSASEVQRVVDSTMRRFGRIDVLVNNAGYGLFGPFEEVSPQELESQFLTNVFGTFTVTRAVLPTMRRQRAGHIFNMSSNGGFRGVPGASAYSGTKFAIEGMSESLAYELAGFGIKITLVEPGAFRTNFLDAKVLQRGKGRIADYDEYRAESAAATEARNRRQIGDPERLGQAIIHLANNPEPPLRFIAGSDAVKVVEAKLTSVAEELDRWRSLSLSTDFD